VLVLEALEVALDVVGEVGIARLATVAQRVLAGADPEAVLAVVGSFHVDGANLWNLEGAQADERTELDDEVVALAVCGSAEVLDLPVGEPDLVFVPIGRFDSHYDYFSFRY